MRPIPSHPVARALDLAAIYVRTKPLALRSRGLFDSVRQYVNFVGAPRSGHSVVGALLDAHPNAVVASEEGALQYVYVGFGRQWVFRRLLWNTEVIGHSQTHRGAPRGGGYAYDVPGQWQGRHRRIEVIGDKYGPYNTERLSQSPSLLGRLRRTVGVPVMHVHVVRNPFDTISTMARRAAEDASTPVDVSATVAQFSALCQRTEALLSRAHDEGDATYELRHEAFVSNPRAELSALCEALGLEASGPYLDACAGIVAPTPHPSRHLVSWSVADREAVETLIASSPSLRGYTFEA